jgi:hypothetical protein
MAILNLTNMTVEQSMRLHRQVNARLSQRRADLEEQVGRIGGAAAWPFRAHVIVGLLIVLYGLYPCPAQCQDTTTPPHTSSTISLNNRFEIIQSHLAAKWTFRLDRVCGFVSQLVRTREDRTAWEKMLIEKLPACANDGKTHYQLFSSSLAARHTFLINTDTGTSWVLTTRAMRDGSESAVWLPFAE